MICESYDYNKIKDIGLKSFLFKTDDLIAWLDAEVNLLDKADRSNISLFELIHLLFVNLQKGQIQGLAYRYGSSKHITFIFLH